MSNDAFIWRCCVIVMPTKMQPQASVRRHARVIEEISRARQNPQGSLNKITKEKDNNALDHICSSFV